MVQPLFGYVFISWIRERAKKSYLYIVCVYTQTRHTYRDTRHREKCLVDVHNTQFGAAAAQVIIENTQRKLSKLQSMT